MKKAIATAIIGCALAGPVLAESPLTANVGMTSNYLWRGAPQSADESAVSGGIDYAHNSGLYVGTWVSSVGGGSQYEHDIYIGFGGEASSVSYDVSYVKYMYPVGDTVELDFDEIILNVGFKPVTFTYATTTGNEAGVLEDNTYMALSAEFEVKKNLVLGIVFGSYDLEEVNKDYTHYQISLSKDDFVFAYDAVSPEVSDGSNDSPRVSVSWSKSFDL